jgi:hypothetical protein
MRCVTCGCSHRKHRAHKCMGPTFLSHQITVYTISEDPPTVRGQFESIRKNWTAVWVLQCAKLGLTLLRTKFDCSALPYETVLYLLIFRGYDIFSNEFTIFGNTNIEKPFRISWIQKLFNVAGTEILNLLKYQQKMSVNAVSSISQWAFSCWLLVKEYFDRKHATWANFKIYVLKGKGVWRVDWQRYVRVEFPFCLDLH